MTALQTAIIAGCLLLAAAFPAAVATRTDPGTTASQLVGTAGEGEGGAGGRRRLAAVTCAAIHWCWGKTETYNGWCHKPWDGVTTGAEPTCTYTNPDKPTCVPSVYLTRCAGGEAALDYFFGFYGWGPAPTAVDKAIVQAICDCNWCAAATAAAGLPAAMGWGPSPVFAAQTYGPPLAKLEACCTAERNGAFNP